VGLTYSPIQEERVQVPGGGGRRKKRKVIRFSDFEARDAYERELKQALQPFVVPHPEVIEALDDEDEDDLLIELLARVIH
jgi:hypothetical protein